MIHDDYKITFYFFFLFCSIENSNSHTHKKAIRVEHKLSWSHLRQFKSQEGKSQQRRAHGLFTSSSSPTPPSNQENIFQSDSSQEILIILIEAECEGSIKYTSREKHGSWARTKEQAKVRTRGHGCTERAKNHDKRHQKWWWEVRSRKERFHN